MKEIIAFIATMALLTVLVLFVISLIYPNLRFNKKILKTKNRKKLILYYSGIIFSLFVIIGVFAPPPAENDHSNSIIEETSSQEPQVESIDENKSQQPKLSDSYDVVKVIDGDTIDVSINGQTSRLRLIGIDTPETVDPRKPVQCFGKESSDKAKELLEGKKVRLESDDSQDNRDKYDRLLRYVYLEDGTMYNKLIITEGYAHEYTYNLPYKYQAEFKQAQKDAEQAGKGLWSSSTCSGDTEKPAEKEKEPAAPTAHPVPAQTQPSQPSNCDPNYTPCIPNVSYDLDCGDISTSVTVIGIDKHRFDRDGDGHGCESN